ncbi:MAG: prephenate dehydratase [Gammaproteobacteria bacterium]|nr:prephenate dehydratase [Gammaproteobacteria bacterium]
MVSEKKISEIRKRIDDVDKKLIRLISERASLATDIADIKNKSKGPTKYYRPEREAQILRQVIKANKGPLSDKAIAVLFRELISACLALEQQLKVAYLGPEGTFTHSATIKHFGHAVEVVPLISIDQVFHDAQSGNSDYGVVPVENSIEGIVNHTLDMLMDSDLKISGEVELRINQYLMGRTKVKKNIKKIYSHQQSFAQCRRWLEANMPGIEQIPVNSNAEAARLANKDNKSAAIAGKANADLYKLKIIDRNVEDEPDNSTRFLIISPDEVPKSGDDKTSLLFSMPSKPGALLNMLKCFADSKVNMTRIESRPSRKGLWEYIFFVDLDGHIQDARVARSISRLQEEASMVKVLGSYPRAVL